MDSSSQNSDDDDIKLIMICTEPTSSTVRKRLALELECEIFGCLKLPVQRKFISGLGTEIYEMCGPKIRALLKAGQTFLSHILSRLFVTCFSLHPLALLHRPIWIRKKPEQIEPINWKLNWSVHKKRLKVFNWSSGSLFHHRIATTISKSKSKGHMKNTNLFVTKSGQLRLDDRPSFTNRNRIQTTRSLFQFTKDSNGSFSIYSLIKNKYLKSTHMYPSRVGFIAIDESSAEKFVIFCHSQTQQSGFLVDISTLAGSFLYMDMENDRFVVSNSRTPPANKFLIADNE